MFLTKLKRDSIAMSEYIDDFLPCRYTHSTLYVISPDISADEISKRLQLKPSSVEIKGEKIRNHTIKQHSWSLISKDKVESKDSRRHIDWIIGLLIGKEDIISDLQRGGAKFVIGCFWVSNSGRGGPILDSSQMKFLGESNIDLFWDVLFKSGVSDHENESDGEV